MKEYADKIRKEIRGIMEGLPDIHGQGLYTRLGQLNKIRININLLKNDGLLDGAEVRELKELELDSYELVRNKLPQD